MKFSTLLLWSALSPCAFTSSFVFADVNPSQAQGFAQAAGVTGGYGGKSIVVTNLNDTGAGSLREAINAVGPRTITFKSGMKGTIQWNSLVWIDSGDVTIDGDGADITITGYSLNVFAGRETAVRNVIIHGLTFADTVTNRNAIVLDFGSRDIWIDHCSFRNNSTGDTGQPIGLTNRTAGQYGNSGVTISWNHFMAPNIKSILIGGDDSHTAGVEARISLHHNWFDGVDARNPRIRYATVHMWNNYLSNWVEYGVAAAVQTELLAENNVFENSKSQAALLTSYVGTANSVNASGNLSLGSPKPVVSVIGSFPQNRITYRVEPEVADSALKQRIIASAGAGGASPQPAPTVSPQPSPVPTVSPKPTSVPTASPAPTPAPTSAACAVGESGGTINVASASSDGGYAWIVPLALSSASDSSSAPTASSVRLFENGVAIGPAHSLHQDIRDLGAGRFSHWNNRIQFSASNNTNPKTNGRKYTYCAKSGLITTNPAPTPSPTPASLCASGEKSGVIHSASASSDGGYAWIAPLALSSASDSNSAPTASSVRLFENGRALGPAHSLHQDIRDLGAGRFSHWNNRIQFSASDNSSPRTNGRKYSYCAK